MPQRSEILVELQIVETGVKAVDGAVVATDNLLFFEEGVSREQGGDYMCVAKNRHGRAEMVTRVEVICELEAT